MLQAIDLIPDEKRIDTVFQRLNQLCNATLRPLQLHAVGIERCIVVHPHAVQVCRVFLAEHFAQFRVHQALAQGTQDNLFQLLFAERQPVLTGSLIARSAAAILGGGHLRHATVAFAAFHKERKQLFGATLCSIGSLRVQISLAFFHAVPKLVANDAQLRHVNTNPCRLIIHASVLTARVRIFEEALLPPNLATDIQLVIQNTDAATTVAVDGARAPIAAALRFDAFGIQFKRDLAR